MLRSSKLGSSSQLPLPTSMARLLIGLMMLKVGNGVGAGARVGDGVIRRCRHLSTHLRIASSFRFRSKHSWKQVCVWRFRGGFPRSEEDNGRCSAEHKITALAKNARMLRMLVVFIVLKGICFVSSLFWLFYVIDLANSRARHPLTSMLGSMIYLVGSLKSYLEKKARMLSKWREASNTAWAELCENCIVPYTNCTVWCVDPSMSVLEVIIG